LLVRELPTVSANESAMKLPLWLALVTGALLRWPLLIRPIQDLDEATFASIAALLQAGGALYGDGGVDNKPPLVFLVYQFAFTLAGRYAMWAVHLLVILTVVATAWLLAQVARRLGGERAGFYTALLYGVFSMAPDPTVLAANTENFMMLPMAAAMACLVHDRWPRALRLAGFGAGIAIAFLFKQIALLSLGVGLLAALEPEEHAGGRIRSVAGGVAACGIGFALPLAGMAGWLAAQHELGAALHWTVERLLSHHGPSVWAAPLGKLLVDGAIMTLLFVGTALPLCLAATLRLRAASDRDGHQRLLVGWLLLSAIGVIAGGHFFDHYYTPLVGPLAVLGGLYLATRGRRAWNLAIGGFAAGLMLFAAIISGDNHQPFWRRAVRDYEKLAPSIRSRTRADERIFVWGNAPGVYVMADRLPATRFVGFLRGLRRAEGQAPEGAWDGGPEVWALLADDFARHPPALIIDTSPANFNSFGAYPLGRFPAVQALVASGYVRDAVIDGVTYYRRMSGPGR
jgi:4-amino-4-deoxy-L-arabinose transferase-like glycosyltransferase